MIYLLFSLLIAAAYAAKGDVNQVNGAKDLPLTPVLAQSKENSAGACRTLCAASDECVEATFVNGMCSLFHNVVLSRADINGAVYYKKDRGEFIVDCVGQKLYDDMCRSSVDGAKRDKCSDWIEDGTCDHGFTLSDTYHQIFLNCEKFNFDGGDCSEKGAVDADRCFSDLEDDVDPNCKVPQNGVTEDCWGQVLRDEDCVVAAVGITKCSEWLGDKSCDGGQTVSDSGVVINFACEKFEYDKGDCDKPIEDTLPPTSPPTPSPTDAPTKPPVADPTATPTESPTKAPTGTPTGAPTKEPTDAPTAAPTDAPVTDPTATPTDRPTATPPPIETPTESPTVSPTEGETPTPIEPVTDAPTGTPTKAPTLDMTVEPTPPPSSGEYVDNGECIGVESNWDDFKDDSNDEIAALALDGEFYEITRAWDQSSHIICDPNQKIYQNKEASKTIFDDDGIKTANAVLCYGKPNVLDENKLYAVWNAGKGAALYGIFDSYCNSLTWDQVANDECQDVCNKSECPNNAEAIHTKPCGPAPSEPPTPQPTVSPTNNCGAITDEGACLDTPWPPCAFKDNKCIDAPCLDQSVSSKCQKYEACEWDKKKKVCGYAPAPTPKPTPLPTDECGGFNQSKCKKKDQCEFDTGLGLCRLKVVDPTESPTDAPTQSPTQDTCKQETNKKKCKDPCEWKSGKCKRKPDPTPEPTKSPVDDEDCTTYVAYQQRIADAVKNKKASKDDKTCAKYGGLYDKKNKECTPYPYDVNDEKTGKTAKFKCKKIKDEKSCGCLKNKCKLKTKKRGRKVKVKCKGKHQFVAKIHGLPDPNIG